MKNWYSLHCTYACSSVWMELLTYRAFAAKPPISVYASILTSAIIVTAFVYICSQKGDIIVKLSIIIPFSLGNIIIYMYKECMNFYKPCSVILWLWEITWTRHQTDT